MNINGGNARLVLLCPAWRKHGSARTVKPGTVNLAALTSEQTKFLSQLGEFRDDQTWGAGCDPEEFQEAVALLKQAGVEDLFVQFGD
jgi:hypothetical protein